ncbi:glycosyltransferase family 4 protein [Methanococcoides sp. SA1]|nr:glycosyltransferase family 4 protein [Methanococcoides sp. SA1]
MSENMNTLYDYSIFRLQRYGGISRYFYELINRVSTYEDTHVNLFEGFHINEYGLSRNRKNFHSYRGYKTPSIKYTGYALETLNQIWLKNTYSKLSDIDIYHPTYYRKDLHKFKKSHIVLTVYDMIHELYSDQFWNSKSVINSKSISINSADIIISISENTKKDLVEICDVPEDKIKVVYLANSLKQSKYINFDSLKKKYNIMNPYILYVGVRGGYKNFSLLLDAYTSHFSNNFDLVCFGANEFDCDELEIIKKNNLLNKVIHLNGPDDLLASLYKNAFCFVYPSMYEGFGIPPLEAMAMGCPVIASKASSIPEVVGNAGILFDPASKDSLVDAIESLTNSELKRNKLIKCGFEQEKKFSWDKMANETLGIYKSII